jgi:hypothetical protein
MKKKPEDRHMLGLKHELESINAINEWRNEAVKHAITKEQVRAIDDGVLYYREQVAKARSEVRV